MGLNYQGRELKKYINLIDILVDDFLDDDDIGQKDDGTNEGATLWHEVNVEIWPFDNNFRIILDGQIQDSGDIFESFQTPSEISKYQEKESIPVSELRNLKSIFDPEFF